MKQRAKQKVWHVYPVAWSVYENHVYPNRKATDTVTCLHGIDVDIIHTC